MNLNENLDHHDMVGQINSIVTVDEYKAKAGGDDEIITLSFIIKGQQASQDLVDWFERGYEWILDAQVSDGEYIPGKNLVFVEIPRRSTAPDRIIEILKDLETLTDIKVTEWTVKIDGEEYDADPEIIKTKIRLSPHDYRLEHEDELNEMREIAGIKSVNKYIKQDSILRNFIAKAGL
jgi:hypothetical protein